jgi:hypothetical protein
VHALGLRNRALGHVFLVDADGRIRWRAAGDADLDDAALASAAGSCSCSMR